MASPAGPPLRPSPADLRAAVGRRVPDVVAPGLRVLFCGINPGLWSGAVGHHFARPGNRFFTVLHRSGLTPVRLEPSEDRCLLDYGLGVTNLVARSTASAEELSAEELRTGGRTLRRKVGRLRPETVAFVGITAYRLAYGSPRATVGEQEAPMAGARVWVLPNPSGLQATYQLDDLVELYGALPR